MKRVIFVGQAMPRLKRDPHDWKSLNEWLYSTGLTIEDIREHFFYTALVDYFPGVAKGGHRVPTEKEIQDEKDRLERDFLKFKPELVVPIGRLSIAYCLGRKVEPLTASVGSIYNVRPYELIDTELPVIPLPHPSGVSTWYHKDENRSLLQKALVLFRNNL